MILVLFRCMCICYCQQVSFLSSTPVVKVFLAAICFSTVNIRIKQPRLTMHVEGATRESRSSLCAQVNFGFSTCKQRILLKCWMLGIQCQLVDTFLSPVWRGHGLGYRANNSAVRCKIRSLWKKGMLLQFTIKLNCIYWWVKMLWTNFTSSFQTFSFKLTEANYGAIAHSSMISRSCTLGNKRQISVGFSVVKQF